MFKKKIITIVSNLYDAISDVETNEKNRPNPNKIIIKNKTDLLMFFHQL